MQSWLYFVSGALVCGPVWYLYGRWTEAQVRRERRLAQVAEELAAPVEIHVGAIARWSGMSKEAGPFGEHFENRQA